MNLEKEINRYSKLNGYPISSYEDIACDCGCKEFRLYSDDDEGGAFVICTACETVRDIENSRKNIEELISNICSCDNDRLNIGVGKAYYPGSTDPRWVYVGAHCEKCGLNGVYVDWQER